MKIVVKSNLAPFYKLKKKYGKNGRRLNESNFRITFLKTASKRWNAF